MASQDHLPPPPPPPPPSNAPPLLPPSIGGGGLGGSQFGDTTHTKIFVGGLAWETQRDTMRQYFEQFGEILEAVVITDKNTGRSKGYGFVTFKDPESASRACENPTPIIDGRRANCNLAALGVRTRYPPFHQGARAAGGGIRHFSPLIGAAQSSSSHHHQQQQQQSQQQQAQQQQAQQQQQQQIPGAPFTYPQAAAAAAFTYAPYGYAYVHEYPYQSLYNPYGPQLSAAAGTIGGAGGGGNATLYTYSGFGASTYPMASPTYALQYPSAGGGGGGGGYAAGGGGATTASGAVVPSSASTGHPQHHQQQQQHQQQSSNAPGVCVLPIQA